MTLQVSTIPPDGGPSSPSPGHGEVRDRPAGSRCVVCRSPHIDVVCAACHAPLCFEHDGVLRPVGLGRLQAWREARRTTRRRTTETVTAPAPRRPENDRATTSRRATDSSAFRARGPATPPARTAAPPERAAGERTREHVDLLLDPERRDGAGVPQPDEVHLCPECLPWDRWGDPEIVAASVTGALGLVVLLIGLAQLTLVGLDAALVALVVGGLLAVVGGGRLLLRRTRARKATRSTSQLTPVARRDPHLRAVRHRETVDADIKLFANRSYERSILRVTGAVEVDASWSRAHASEPPTSLPIRSGAVVLTGPAHVRFLAARGARIREDTVLALTPQAEDHPVLSSFGEGHDARWRIVLPYEVRSRGRAAAERLRLDVVPTLVPGARRRGLDVEISWDSAGRKRFERGLPLVRLDLVELHVPAVWGHVQPNSDQADEGTVSITVSEATGRRTVTWRGITITKPTARGSHRLSLRFAEEIETDVAITGRIEAHFGGAVSGATGALLHYSGGGQRPEWRRNPEVASRNVSPVTVVAADVSLELAGLRYQETRSVPDRIRAEDYGTEARVDGVAPDHATIASLCDVLGESGYYVKRVVENTPQLGQRRTIARSWQIGGRHYTGVYPVDFDIAVSGEDPGTGPGPDAWLVARLDVSGAYANDAMEARIGQEHANLESLICESLRGRAPEDVVGDVVDDEGDDGGAIPGPSGQDPRPAPGGTDRQQTRADFESFLDQALRDSRITREEYRRLREELDRMFDDPGEGGES